MSTQALWYDKSATRFNEALPLGSGRLGALMYGGCSLETIVLNEDTLWTGPGEYTLNPETPALVEQTRQLVSEKKYWQAHQFINEHILPKQDECQSYGTAGTLKVTFDGIENRDVAGYRRQLDIGSALYCDAFTCNGQHISRKAFTSIPDRVFAWQIEQTGQGAVSLDIAYECPNHYELSVKDSFLTVNGLMPSMNPGRFANNKDNLEGIWETDEDVVSRKQRAIRYILKLKAEVSGKGATLEDGDTFLRIRNAETVVIYVSIVSSFDGFDREPGSAGRSLDEEAFREISDASQKGFDALFQAHSRIHQHYFQRSTFTLETDEQEDTASTLPVNQRLESGYDFKRDPALIPLIYQYGRYLLIASSFPGTQAANLQGIWNDRIHPPWSGRYTTNINAEMNYWPAMVTNLEEMAGPFVQMVKELAVAGEETARVLYGARGWCLHHNTDLWRWTSYVQFNATHAYWPFAGGWVCQEIWRLYEFTGNTVYLTEGGYQAIKGAALFFLDYLVRSRNGAWGTSPATSPENSFVDPASGKQTSVGEVSAVDLTIVRELFEHCLKAAEITGESDDAFLYEVTQKLAELDVPIISPEGHLLEWNEDFAEADIHHRHVSHLYGVFPGNEFTPENKAAYYQACKQSLLRRGDESTGWAMAWRICLWARFLDGDHAFSVIKRFLNLIDTTETSYGKGGGIYPNLFCAHPPFQIDGNFGAIAGIAEMLLQSHRGVIDLLPALPIDWHTGSVTGLRTRGGFEVNMSWKNGRLTTCRILSKGGTDCTIRWNGKMKTISLKQGSSFDWSI